MLTSEELGRLHRLQRGLTLFTGALTEIENLYQENMNAREAVAKRGRLLCEAIEEVSLILEGKKPIREG